MLDGQNRFGNRDDRGDVRRDERRVGNRGDLAGLCKHVQRTLVGVRLVAHLDGELHLDAGAADGIGGKAAKVEHERIARSISHTDNAALVRVARAETPLVEAGALSPVDTGDVEQRQRQIRRQPELFVVPRDEVVAQVEGDHVARIQLAARRRRGAIHREHCDVDRIRADRTGGGGLIGDRVPGEVQAVHQ